MIIVDSHVFIWALKEPGRLGQKSVKALENRDISVCVSAVSLWELELKHRKGKLPYDATQLLKGIEDLGFEFLDLSSSHIECYGEVSLNHNDPFDAMLVAVSIAATAKLMTADGAILASDHKTLNARL